MTNNMKVAEMMRKELGVQEPNCTRCIFGRHIGGAYYTCKSIVATAILKMPVRTEQNKKLPLFPIVTLRGKNNTEFDLPSIIGHESGIISGDLVWPERFDPVYILSCIYYTTEGEIKTEISQSIDKG